VPPEDGDDTDIRDGGGDGAADRPRRPRARAMIEVKSTEGLVGKKV
jgi:hypothetical protein